MYVKACPGYKGKIYLSFVQGYRDENGKAKQKTIKKIGYLDELKKKYDDPIAHFRKLAKEKTNEEINELTIKNLSAHKLDENDKSKNLGYVVLKKIYHELGIDSFLKDKQKKFKLEYNLNDVFSLLVFSRIIYPASKRDTYLNKDLYFDKFNFSQKDMYRSLSYLKDYKEDLENLLWNKTKDKYNRKTDKSYYDCTNFYFEIDCNDEDEYEVDKNGKTLYDENGNPIIKRKGYRKRGPEKNHRPDPIIEMGLFMDGNGLPICYNLFSGNESEKLSLYPEVQRLKHQFGLKRTIVVADRGLNTSDNILKIAGTSMEFSKKSNGYVYGQSVRGADEEFKKWVLDEKDYKTDIITDEQNGNEIKFIHKSRIYPKKINVKRTDKNLTKSGKVKIQSIKVDQKQMVYYSQKYADRQRYERSKMIEKAKDLIKNPGSYTKATSYGAANYVKNLKFNKTTGEIADTSHLVFDEEKLKNEEKFDGYYSIVTSEENLSDLEIRNIYRGLSRIENTFRVTKTTLEARPVYVWTPDHIEAHFLTCFVALVIVRLLEEQLHRKYSPEEIVKALKNYTSTNLENDVYKQSNYNSIIKDIDKLFNLELDRKYRTLSEIRKILNN